MELERTSWHHAPEHRFVPGLTYMITGATLYHRHFYPTSALLEMLQGQLLELTATCDWQVNVWAVFSDHYHLIGYAGENSWAIRPLIQRMHSQFSLALNLKQGKPGRKVWHQYWDTCLTLSASYYARLNYVINNPVHHGLVSVAANYPYCSAGLVERGWRSAFRRKVQSFKYDRIHGRDDFHPIWIR
jgi:putative transposase